MVRQSGCSWHKRKLWMQVVTISGRTIRPEAQASPAAAEAAIQHIDELLKILPADEVAAAAAARTARRAPATA